MKEKITNSANFQQYIELIENIPIDNDEIIVNITYRNLKEILHLCNVGVIRLEEFLYFIDLIEVRDGLDFEDNSLKEFVHLISNHEINDIDVFEEYSNFLGV